MREVGIASEPFLESKPVLLSMFNDLTLDKTGVGTGTQGVTWHHSGLLRLSADALTLDIPFSQLLIDCKQMLVTRPW